MSKPSNSDVKKRLDEAYDLATNGKDHEKALRTIDEVLSDYPNMLAAFRKKAAIHAYVADFPKAIAILNSVIAENPDQPTDYFFRGWWHLVNDDLNEAVSDLTKTLDLSSAANVENHTESAHFFRAVALLKLGKNREAIADCQHVRDDFVIHLRNIGKISKSDILAQAGGK